MTVRSAPQLNMSCQRIAGVSCSFAIAYLQWDRQVTHGTWSECDDDL